MSNKINDRVQELSAGQMLGRYELLMPIAKGGMGTVWAARLKGSRGFRKLFAIKTILRTLEHPAQEQMLFQEAVLASQIHHQNVAETLELGEHEGTLYLVMELVSGESLRFVLKEAQALGGMPMPVCVNLIGQVCRGLAAAHDLRDKNGERVGLVHRDVSPPNIMITEAGTVKIVDFGVATTSSSGNDGPGEIKGKISYLAPEQLRGEAVDARADVFATGILLYLLTVGKHPFRTASEPSTIARILSRAPAATPSALVEDYPDALEQIVMCALHKDRRERFQSITAMLDALENAFPNAFGPRADEAAAQYLIRLMKDRIFERKTTLRMAEELAERSSSRHSEHSLPVVTTSSAPVSKSKSSAVLGLAGLVTGLGAAALAGTLYLQGFSRAAQRSAEALMPRALPAAITTHLSSASPAPGSATAEASAAATTSAATRLIPSSIAQPKRAQSARSAKSQQPELEPVASAAEALSAQPPPAAPEMPTPTLAAVLDSRSAAAEPEALRVLQALPTTSAVAPPLIPVKAAPVAPAAPRLLSSRMGQNQLLTNPASAASRVRLPVGLDRMGQTFNAVVRICVTAAGSVSKVDILRSAGPVLDPQIPSALSHWRYRPLLEAGEPTPFCYVLNYEISAR